MLVDNLQLKDAGFIKARDKLNEKIKEKKLNQGTTEWDGLIWAYGEHIPFLLSLSL
jgi:hypothetical protein